MSHFLMDERVEQQMLVKKTNIEAGVPWQDKDFRSERFSKRSGLRPMLWDRMRLDSSRSSRERDWW